MTIKNKNQRINNIIGQLNGVKNMMDNKKDCSDILTQLSAIKSAVSSLSNHMIEEDFAGCLKKGKKNDELKKIIKTLIKNN